MNKPARETAGSDTLEVAGLGIHCGANPALVAAESGTSADAFECRRFGEGA